MATTTTTPSSARVYLTHDYGQSLAVPASADVYLVDDIEHPLLAQHMLYVLVDDAPFTEFFQAKHFVEQSPAPGPPYTSTTGLFPAMPTLSALVANGVRLTSVRASPECSPTRAAVATTVYGFRNGIMNVVNLNAAQFGDLGEFGDPGYVYPTVFHQLGLAGVRTAIVGKLHMSADYNQTYNGRQGLGWQILERFCAANTYTETTLRNLNQTAGDYITLSEINGDVAGYYYFAHNHGRTNGGPGGEILVDGTYATTYQVDRAIEWWSTVDNTTRAFMWLGFNGVHTPLGGRAPNSSKDFPPDHLTTTQEYKVLRDAEASELTVGDSPLSFWEDQMAAMEAVDAELGRLLASMPPGVRARTTVVVMADNGVDAITLPAARNDLIPGSGLWKKDFGEVGNYVIDNGRIKGQVYHFGTAVECVWSGPGKFTSTMLRKGQECDIAIDHVDIGRTILDYFGAEVPPTDGVSFYDAIYTDASINYRTHARQFQYSESCNPNGDWTDNLALADGGETRQLDQAMWGWYFTSLGGAPTGRYHLIRKRGIGGVADGAWHYSLYRHYDEDNVAVDPAEMTDLYGNSTYSEIAADLEARIDALLASSLGGGNGIRVTLEDGVSTKIIPTVDLLGELVIAVDDGGVTKYIHPTATPQVGVPVENSDTGSGDKVIPYIDVAVDGGWALAVDNGDLSPVTVVKVIPCDQNAALPVSNSTGKVIPSTDPGDGTPFYIVVTDAVAGDKNLLLQVYP